MVDSFKKKLPINPAQILAERSGFKICPEKNSNPECTNFVECGNCGIGTNDFIIGSLTVLSHRIKLPVCLIERVHCRMVSDYFENEYPELKDNLVGYQRLDVNQAVYHWFNCGFYYIIDIPHVYNLENPISEETSICYKFREKNSSELLMETTGEEHEYRFPEINEEACVRRDLRHFSDIMAGNDGLKQYILKKENKEYLITYHANICEATKYTELLFPIYSDSSKNRKVLALLSIGQLAIHDLAVFNEEDPFLKNSRDSGREFNTIDGLLNTKGEDIQYFIERMAERTKFQRARRLYDLQHQWLATFRTSVSKADSIEDVEMCIVNLFKNIVSESEIGICLLFLPDHPSMDNGEAKDPLVYSIQGNDSGSAYHERRDNIFLKNEKLSGTFGKLHNVEMQVSGCIEGEGATNILDENTELFFKRGKSDVFAVLLQWDEKYTLDDTQEALFLSILDACYAHIMAETAKVKQRAIDTFREESVHDLIQRLGTLDSAINSFKNKIQVVEKNPNLPKEMVAFKNAAFDYNSEIKAVYDHLMLIRNQLATKTLSYVPNMTSFSPYSDILFGLQIQLAADKDCKKHGKQLLLSKPIPSDPQITADKIMLTRILNNLLVNAIKYAYQGTKIYVDCEYDAAKSVYVFNIISFGPCIPIDKVDFIFESGKRLNTNVAGHGLGLHTSRKLARSMGGDVNLVSGTSDDQPISRYYIPAIAMAESLWKNGVWPSELDSLKRESTLLKKHTGDRVNAIARLFNITNHYKEVLSDDVVDYFEWQFVNESQITHRYERPTYRTIFSVTIPQS